MAKDNKKKSLAQAFVDKAKGAINKMVGSGASRTGSRAVTKASPVTSRPTSQTSSRTSTAGPARTTGGSTTSARTSSVPSRTGSTPRTGGSTQSSTSTTSTTRTTPRFANPRPFRTAAELRAAQEAERENRGTSGASLAAQTAKNAVKGALNDLKTTADIARNPNEQKYVDAEKIKNDRLKELGVNTDQLNKAYEGQYGNLIKQEHDKREWRKEALKKDTERANKLAEEFEGIKGQTDSKVGKFALDAEKAFVEMGVDAVSGAVGGPVGYFGSMGARVIGSSYRDAKEQGATDDEAARFAFAEAAKEGGTEAMFTPMGKLGKGIFGGGYAGSVADKLSEKVANKLAGKASGQTAKDVVYGTTTAGFAAFEEGLEEMVSEGLDPMVANTLYAQNVTNRQQTQLKKELDQKVANGEITQEQADDYFNKNKDQLDVTKSLNLGDVLYSGAIGGVLGIAGGGTNALSQNMAGRTAMNVYGPDGIKDLAARVVDADEEDGAEISGQARAVAQMVKNGETVAHGQVAELMEGVRAQEQKNADNFSDSVNAANSKIEEAGTINPVQMQTLNIDGREVSVPTIAENTQREYASRTNAAVSTLTKEAGMDEGKAKQIAEPIARIQLGISLDASDIEKFTLSHPENRAAFTTVTGMELPDTNQATRKALREAIAENRITASQNEENAVISQMKGIVQQSESYIYGKGGQSEFAHALNDADITNATAMQGMKKTFDDFYGAGITGMSYDEISSIDNPVYAGVSDDIKRRAYTAGVMDQTGGLNEVDGAIIEKGEALRDAAARAKEQGLEKAGTVEFRIPQERMKEVGFTRTKLYQMIAKELNIGVVVVDGATLDEMAKQSGNKAMSTANGFYRNGQIYVSLDADRALDYVFAHELTHHLKRMAPEQYQKLASLVADRWRQKGGIQQAIEREQADRRNAGENLSAEEVFEEIIADSTYEFLLDDTFIDQIAKSDPSLSQKLLEAIRWMIDRIRSLLSDEDLPRVSNPMLYDQLDILKEAEALWLDAFNEARRNALAVQKNGDRTAFSISPTLRNDLTNLISNRPSPSSEIYVGESSQFLTDVINAKPFRVLMPPKKAYASMVSEDEARAAGRYDKNLHYHNLGVDGLMRALEASEDPVIAIADVSDEKGKNRDDRIILITDQRHEGKILTVIQNVDSHGMFESKHIDTNKVITAYGDEYIDGLIKDAASSDRVLAIDKKRISGITSTPEGTSLSRRSSAYFENNIQNFWANVNYLHGKNTKLSAGDDTNTAMLDALEKAGAIRTSQKRDQEYMDAVNAGDMEKAQQMVDEAAKKAGYDIRAYHGASDTFTVFDLNKIGSHRGTTFGDGFYFAKDKEAAQNFVSSGTYRDANGNIASRQGRLMNVYLKLDDPVEVDIQNVIAEGKIKKWADLRRYMKQQETNDTDGRVIRSVNDGGTKPTDVYVTYDSAQAKSADPITYDDNGNVIPLSERFNENNPDIRFSVKNVPEEINKQAADYKPTTSFDNGTIRYSVRGEKMPHAIGEASGDLASIGGSIYVDVENEILRKEFTNRELRNKWAKKNGLKKKEIKALDEVMDKLATFMEKSVDEYRYIGLNDTVNATLDYKVDKDGNPTSVVLSAMVKNGEYPINFDFTSVCKKRVAFQNVLARIAKQTKNGSLYDKIDLTPDNIKEINDILQKHGFEVACPICFVEARRYENQAYVDKITTKWNKLVKEKNPDAPNMNAANLKPEDIAQMQDEIDKAWEYFDTETKRIRDEVNAKIEANPELKQRKKDLKKKLDKGTITEAEMEEYQELEGVSWDVKIDKLTDNPVFQKMLTAEDLLTEEGTRGIKSIDKLFGLLKQSRGASAPKETTAFTAYNSEIAMLMEACEKKLSKKDKQEGKTGADLLREKLYDIGGVRMQSFSDFQIQNIYDYIQLVGDLAAGRLPAHAYTKELAFAELLGMCGIKVNMSAVCDIDPDAGAENAGLTKDGDYLIGEQSIPFAEAVEMQNRPGYTSNIGIIMVGLSDNHIWKMLDDSDIRYIIPYHKSGLPVPVQKTTHLELARDYTNVQNTVKITSAKDKNNKKVDAKAWLEEDHKKTGDWKKTLINFNNMVKKEGWTVNVSSSGHGTGDFDVYSSLDETNNPRKTADAYIEHCMSKGKLPMFYEFAGHKNYYKMSLFDFNVADNKTGRCAPQKGVQSIYPGLNVGKGETDTSQLESLIEKYFNEQNEIEKRQAPKYADAIGEILNNTNIIDQAISNEEIEEAQKGFEKTSFSQRRDQEYRFSQKSVTVDEPEWDPSIMKGVRYLHDLKGKVPEYEVEFKNPRAHSGQKRARAIWAGYFHTISDSGANLNMKDIKSWKPTGRTWGDVSTEQQRLEYYLNTLWHYNYLKLNASEGNKVLGPEAAIQRDHDRLVEVANELASEYGYPSYYDGAGDRLISEDVVLDALGWGDLREQSPSSTANEEQQNKPTREAVYEYMYMHPEEYNFDVDELLGNKGYAKKTANQQNTINELKSQIDKLKQQQRRSKPGEFGEDAVKGACNDLIKSLMADDISGKKTNNKLVKQTLESVRGIWTGIQSGGSTDAIASRAHTQAKAIVDSLRMAEGFSEEYDSYDDYVASDAYSNLIKSVAADLTKIASRGQLYTMTDRYTDQINALKQQQEEAVLATRMAEGRIYAPRIRRRDAELKAYKAKAKERITSLRSDRDAERMKRIAQNRARTEKNFRSKKLTRFEKDYKWLVDRIVSATDDKHVPSRLIKPLAEFLQYIDLETAHSKELEKITGKPTQKQAKLRDLRAALEEVYTSADAGMILEDEDLVPMIEELQKRIGEAPVRELSTEDLDAAQALLHAIVVDVRNANKSFADDKGREISDTAQAVIWEANEYKANSKNRRQDGIWQKIMDESLVKPLEFFERMGPAMKSVYLGLRRGMDTQANHMKEAKAFFAEVFEGYGKKGKPGSEIEKWRNNSTSKEFELESGEKISLNISQIMSLHCLNKREQALGHILGQGICASEPTDIGKMRTLAGAKDGKQATTMVTYDDVQMIIETLSDEQRQMADKLQNYLNTTVAGWGNETSMLMYDRKKFTEENYFPIESQDVYLAANFEKRANNTESIKNFGFTKGLVVNANNPIVINDIFSVCAKHINQMMLYNAYAPAISDFTRVYNYKATSEDGRRVQSVQAVLADTYGGKIIGAYINKFMADIQGNTQARRGGIERVINTLLANAKKAAIAASPRVALQQPTAIVRALMEIHPKYFMKMDHTPLLMEKTSGRSTMQEMMDHCPTAYWKSMGFNQVDMARDLEDIMMNKEWGRVDTLTMGVYGALDNWTWTKIWKAVKAEVEDTNPDLEVGSDEYWDAVNERARDVFDKTQVVDTPFNRADVMRSKDIMMKSVVSFMAEPLTTFNMFRFNMMKANDLKAQGKYKEAAELAGRTAVVYIAAAMTTAMAAAVADAMRKKVPDGAGDDDDDEDATMVRLWWLNTWANFADNVNPLGYIPIANQLLSYADGWGAKNMALDGLAGTTKAAKDILDKAQGEKENKTWPELITALLKNSSALTGIPFRNLFNYGKAVCDLMGINAFAAEAGSGEEETVESDNILQKAVSLFHKDGGSESGGSSESSGSDGEGGEDHDRAMTTSDIDYGMYNYLYTEHSSGGLVNKAKQLLNIGDPREAEAAADQKAFEQAVNKVKSAGDGKYGEDYYKAINSAATKNYTKMLEAGDIQTIKEMRRVVEAAGGDVEKFDERAVDAAKKALKKNLGEYGNTTARWELASYLRSKGVTDQEISDYVAGSNTAKELQKAIVADDQEKIRDYTIQLYEAGLTDESYTKLYDTRWKHVEAQTTGEFDWPGSGRISSGFGQRWGTLHAGMDIAMPVGSQVTASDGGEVVYTGYDSARGYYVDIKHANGYVSRYQHLSSYGVQKGQKVSKGELIAKSGNTGSSTGPHLHFALYQSTSHSGCTHATSVDPQKMLTGKM